MTGRKTLLVMCGSLGLGNSARLLGVAQAIRRRFGIKPERLRLLVCAGGKAADFWTAHARPLGAEVARLEEYAFSESQPGAARIRWAGFLRPRNAAAYLRNTLRLRALLRRERTDLALIDSDYHFLPLLLAGVPVLALSQAWDVLRRGTTGLPARSLLVERADLLFQRLAAGSVIVPCFDPPAAAGGRTVCVPLIVREEFSEQAQQPGPGGRLYVLTGGSGVGSAELLAYARRYGLPVIGSLPEPAPVLDGAGRPLIDGAAAVIVQGGLSSISECIARRKRMIVLPIEGHAEQLSNAREVERLGLGMAVAGLSDPPELLLEKLELKAGTSEGKAFPGTGGAETAAALLVERLGL
jgi:hypothetical protein